MTPSPADRLPVLVGGWWMLMALVISRVVWAMGQLGVAVAAVALADSVPVQLGWLGNEVALGGLAASLTVLILTAALQTAVLVLAMRWARPLEPALMAALTGFAALVLLALPWFQTALGTGHAMLVARGGPASLARYAATQGLVGVASGLLASIPLVVALGVVAVHAMRAADTFAED